MNRPPPVENHLMLEYSFTGPRPNEKFWAVVAAYADETLVSLAEQRQVTRTSVGPSQREGSTHHDLVLLRTDDPPVWLASLAPP